MDHEVAIAAALLRARLPQAFLENRGANGVRVDDQNTQWTLGHGHSKALRQLRKKRRA